MSLRSYRIAWLVVLPIGGLVTFGSPATSTANSSDTTAPSLTGFAVSIAGQTVVPGTVIEAIHTTDEPVSPIYFSFEDSVGHIYQIGTPDGAGAASGSVTNAWANGSVKLIYIDMFDAADNRTT